MLQKDIAYKYDALDNRIQMDVIAGGATAVTKFALDGWNPAKAGSLGNSAWDVFADLDVNNSLTMRYMRGDSIDEIWAEIGATAYWTLTDRQGSVVDVINQSGALKDVITYDGFGRITSETDPNFGGRLKYTAREFDVETELQYNRARYYDATTGRWISQDPLGFDAGDSNLYRYVRNGPVTGKDPSGNFLLFPHHQAATHYAGHLSREQVVANAAEVPGTKYVMLVFPTKNYNLFRLRGFMIRNHTLGFQQTRLDEFYNACMMYRETKHLLIANKFGGGATAASAADGVFNYSAAVTLTKEQEEAASALYDKMLASDGPPIFAAQKPARPPLPATVIINDSGHNKDFANIFHAIWSSAKSLGGQTHSIFARSVKQAVDDVVKLNRDVKELVFYGHGMAGEVSVGAGPDHWNFLDLVMLGRRWDHHLRMNGPDQTLTEESFRKGGRHHDDLVRLRSRLTSDCEIRFATCNTFEGDIGRKFAKAAAAFFGEDGRFPARKVVGYTGSVGYGPFDDGERVELFPGKDPNW